jgi:hypothetical protein
MVFALFTVGFICVSWGVVVGMVAKKKNRHFIGWFFAGCCLWFLPLIALVVLGKATLHEMGVTDTGVTVPVTDLPTTIFPDTRYR